MRLGLSDTPAPSRDAIASDLGLTQLAELFPPPPGYYAWFGYSVALSGDTALVGAPNYGFPQPSTGAAFVFTDSGGVWSEQAVLTPSDPTNGGEFGWSVALSGSTAVVGSPTPGAGSAYIFTRKNGTWSQQQRVTPSGGQSQQFGWSVAIDGSTLAVGDRSGGPLGAVYIFADSQGTWSQQALLTPSGPDSEFGGSLSISGSTVIVGAIEAPGAAYIYGLENGVWTQQARIVGSPTHVLVGFAVSLSGDTALIASDNAALAYVRSGTTWTLQATLVPSDATMSTASPLSVALSGDTAVVMTGKAWVFTRSGGTWTQGPGLVSSDETTGDNFGSAVAVSGTTVLVGAYDVYAPQSLQPTGAAYVFGEETPPVETPEAPTIIVLPMLAAVATGIAFLRIRRRGKVTSAN